MPDKTILVIDDNEAGRYVTRKVLASAGYAVLEAATGSEGISRLSDHPSLVILDVNLPDIDGFEVCRRIKGNPHTSSIPILHLSAQHTKTVDRAAGLQCAEAYLVQPVEPEELLATVAALLRTQRTEAALREAERRYRALFANKLNGVAHCRVITDRDGRPADFLILKVNEAYEQITGLKRLEIEGRTAREIFPDITRLDYDYIRAFGRIGLSGGEMKLERFFNPLGQWFSVYVYSPSRGEFTAIFSDVTPQKKAEEALRESEARLKTIVENLAEGLIVVEQKGAALHWNRAALEMHGYEEHEDEASFMSRLPEAWELRSMAGQAVPLEQWPIQRMMRGETVRDYEIALVHKKRQWSRIFSYTGVMVRNSRGEPELGLLTIRDVTQRRAAEEALRESEQRFRVAQELSPDGFSILRPVYSPGDAIVDFAWVYENAAIGRMNGTDPQQVIGRRLLEVFPEQKESPFVQAFLHVARTGQPQILEAPYNSSDIGGDTTWFRVAVVPMGRDIAVLAQDISERKRSEHFLRAARISAERAKAEAENANRAKDEFLAVLSHELRTPLSPVFTAVQLLERLPGLPQQAKEYLDIMRRNLELETDLIDDLLDITRIARGKIVLEKRLVDIGELVKQVAQTCLPDGAAKNLRFSIYAAPSLPVYGDPSRLQQVVWNLLKNSIKFTPEGGQISIKCRRSGTAVVLEVKDSGIGIEPQALTRIFDAFEQADRGVTRRFGGLGLGLAITKRLVEMHHGTIEVQSSGRGQGAAFTVRLPAAAADAGAAALDAASLASRPTPRKVLLVEDHEDTAVMMRRLLESSGYEVEAAGSVGQALSKFSARPFDVVISDLGLPDKSGFELIRELRRQGNAVNAIALSGFGQDDDMRRSKEAGFNAHLTKPVNLEALVRALENI